MMSVFLEDRFAGEGAETLRVNCVERHANDPALRNEAGAHQVKEAGQQLLVGEIPGRAKQDDDLRQLGADSRRYLRHCHSHPRPLIPRWIARHSRVSGRQKRDSPRRRRAPISPPQSEACPALELDPLDEIKPLRSPGRKYARNISKKQAGDDGVAIGADDRRERRREQPQGLRQNVGEHEVVRGALAQRGALDAARDDRPAQERRPRSAGRWRWRPRPPRDRCRRARLCGAALWRRRWRARRRRSRRRDTPGP